MRKGNSIICILEKQFRSHSPEKEGREDVGRYERPSLGAGRGRKRSLRETVGRAGLKILLRSGDALETAELREGDAQGAPGALNLHLDHQVSAVPQR